MNDSLEALQERLAVTVDMVEKMDLMTRIAWRIHISDPEGARELARTILRMARTQGDPTYIARALLRLGYCDYVQGKFDSSISFFEQCLPQARQVGDHETEATALQGIAVCQTDRGNYVEAIDLLDDALVIVRMHQFRRAEAMFLNSTGFVHMKLCDYPKALECFQLSLSILEAIGLEQTTMIPLTNIGIIYLMTQEHNLAEPYFQRVLALGQSSRELRPQAISLLSLGEIHHRRKESAAMVDCYEKALEVAITHGDRGRQAHLLSAVGIFLTDSGEFEDAVENIVHALPLSTEAESSFQWHMRWSLGRALAHTEPSDGIAIIEEALAGAIEIGEKDLEGRCHKTLADYYQSIGDTDKAEKHTRRASELRDEIMANETQRSTTRQKLREEIERAAREKEDLRLEKEQLKVEVEHKNRELASKALHLVEKNEFLDSLRKEMSEVAQTLDRTARPAFRSLMRQVDGNIDRDENWRIFEEQFEKVNNNFLRGLSGRYPELSRTELKVCALLKLNLSSKEIAAMLVSSERTIRNHRYRIRKKLELAEEANLTTFFASL